MILNRARQTAPDRIERMFLRRVDMQEAHFDQARQYAFLFKQLIGEKALKEVLGLTRK